MKGIYAWQLAIATALGAYGGFPKAPRWWIKLAEYKVFQFITVWLLVFSRNQTGNEYLWTTIITCIIYFTMYASNELFCKKTDVNTESEE